MSKTIHFSKYQGAGNDFVMLDNRSGEFSSLTSEDITKICSRKYGIGADGLILLEIDKDNIRKQDNIDEVLKPQRSRRASAEMRERTEVRDRVSSEVQRRDLRNLALHLRMKYYNSDGSIASFCGNGGRCFALFAHNLQLSKQCKNVSLLTFTADDGKHEALVYSENRIQISMRDVNNITAEDSQGYNVTLLDTGVPHAVVFTPDIENAPIEKDGSAIRQDKDANVNFVQILDKQVLKTQRSRRTSAEMRERTEVRDRVSNEAQRRDLSNLELAIRTYEKGVEGETEACGTGAVAAAIASVIAAPNQQTHKQKDFLREFGMHEIIVKTKTSTLKVYFTITNNNTVKDIILEGGATKVFDGIYKL